MPELPDADQLFDHFRARLVARYGPDHPQLDEKAARRVRLYLDSLSPEVQAFVASFPALNASQRAVLSTLLES